MTTGVNEFAGMHAALFSEYAEGGTVQRGTGAVTNVRMVVDDGAQEVGQHGRIIGNKRLVSFIKSEWSPLRGDLVTVRGTAAKVDEIMTDDGYLVQAVLHG